MHFDIIHKILRVKMNIKKELENIIDLFQKDEFVKCHDELEHLWREYKNDELTRQESFIVKAFTNAVVVFELENMNRIQHSINVWNTYKKYEYLIDELDSLNKKQYLELKELIYKKKNSK